MKNIEGPVTHTRAHMGSFTDWRKRRHQSFPWGDWCILGRILKQLRLTPALLTMWDLQDKRQLVSEGKHTIKMRLPLLQLPAVFQIYHPPERLACSHKSVTCIRTLIYTVTTKVVCEHITHISGNIRLTGTVKDQVTMAVIWRKCARLLMFTTGYRAYHSICMWTHMTTWMSKIHIKTSHLCTFKCVSSCQYVPANLL